jgi:hypothetical protein
MGRILGSTRESAGELESLFWAIPTQFWSLQVALGLNLNDFLMRFQRAQARGVHWPVGKAHLCEKRAKSGTPPLGFAFAKQTCNGWFLLKLRS